MLKIIWKFFITGLLCNSLLLLNVYATTGTILTDMGSVDSRLEAMNNQLQLLNPGTPEYTATQQDIAVLTGQKINLSQQTNAVNMADSRANQVCGLSPQAPECLSATIEAQQAAAARDVTLAQIAASAQASSERAQAAVAGASNAATLSAADSAALAHAQDAANAAIAGQKVDADARKAEADAATLARETAQQHADALKAYADSQESRNKTPEGHQADVNAAAQAAALVPPLREKELAAIEISNKAAARVTALENEKAQAEHDAQVNRDQHHHDMQSVLTLSLGGAVDNSKLFSDGSHPNISAEDQAMYDQALQADITMVILGTVTNRLNLCKAVPASHDVPDMQTAQAAGLMFVSGEVAEYTDLIKIRANLNGQLKEINGDPNDRQVQSLQQLLESYQKIRAAAVKKKGIRAAAEASYLSAAGLAEGESEMLIQMTNGCSTEMSGKASKGYNDAITTTIIGVVVCLVAAYYGDYNYWGCSLMAIGYVDAEKCKSGGNQSQNDNRNRKMICEDKNGGGAHIHADSDGADPGSTTVSSNITTSCLAKNGTVGNAQNSACGAAIFGIADAGKGGYSACDQADIKYNENMISCPTHALDGTHDENGKFYDKFTSIKPQKNYIEIVSDFIFSAVHAGLLSSMGVSKDAVVKYIKDQSPKFANALDTQLAHPLWRAITWRALAKLVEEAMITNDNMIAMIDSDIAKIQAILDGIHKQMGVGNDGHKADYGASKNYKALDTANSSNSGSGKTSLKTLKPTSGYLDLDLKAQALHKGVLTAAGEIDGGNWSIGNMDKITTLGKSSSAIKAELAKREKALQRAMARNGTPIDIEKEANKFADKLKGITKSGLNASGMSAQDMRSMMSGGESSGNKPHAPSNTKKSSNGNGTFVPPPVESSTPATSSTAKGNDDEAARLAAEAQAGKAGQSVDAAKAGDTVNEDNGYTLFEVITNRYQKSAYPRLFKKVKE